MFKDILKEAHEVLKGLSDTDQEDYVFVFPDKWHVASLQKHLETSKSGPESEGGQMLSIKRFIVMRDTDWKRSGLGEY